MDQWQKEERDQAIGCGLTTLAIVILCVGVFIGWWSL